jgi:hypothetical protein
VSANDELIHIVESFPIGLSLNPAHTLAGRFEADNVIVSLLPESRFTVIGYDSVPPVESVPAGYETTTEYLYVGRVVVVGPAIVVVVVVVDVTAAPSTKMVAITERLMPFETPLILTS